MRKVFVLMTALVLCTTIAHSQSTTDSTKSNVFGTIKFYPLQLLVGEVRLGYEQTIIKHLSLEISPGYLYGIVAGEVDGDIFGFDGAYGVLNTNKGFALRGCIKIYPLSKRENDGFYISPLFLYKYADLSYNVFYYPYTRANINIKMYSKQLLFGYKVTLERKFTFEPYFGFGYKKVYDNEKETSEYHTIQLGISLGFNFHKK